MYTFLPDCIRRTKEEILKERLEIKMMLKAQLSERGDISHVHKLINKQNPITYAAVLNALNPNHPLWSPRVIEFTKQYLATRDAIRNAPAVS